MNTSRRDFLKQAGALGACVCCLGSLSFFESCAGAKNATTAVTETEGMASIAASALSHKGYTIINTKAIPDPIFVIKQADGTYLALRLHCTHKGGPLNVEGDKLVCPWHGSIFSQSGTVIQGPATQPLQHFDVTVAGDKLNIHLS